MSNIPVEFAEIATICTATDVVIGGHTVMGIEDARSLHAGLGVGRDYTNWIKGRVAKYGFQVGVDYEVFDSPDLAFQTGRGGNRRAAAYRLTLDMAKELAMVENNDNGRLVRRYFIWIENASHQRPDPVMRPHDFDHWSNEDMRTRVGLVTMYRQVMNNPSALWMMEKAGFPMPPRQLQPDWRQSDLWPSSGSVTIVVN